VFTSTSTSGIGEQSTRWTECSSQGSLRFADAATRAFFFRKNMSQSYITVLRDLSQLHGAPLLTGMATLLHERASLFNADDHALLTRTAHDLERVSVVFADHSTIKTVS
jgi:hypothetical protein